jgi:hypothetical protein
MAHQSTARKAEKTEETKQGGIRAAEKTTQCQQD